MTQINLSKSDGSSLGTVEVRLTFKQKKSGGLFGAAKDALMPVDPDLVLVLFKGASPVNYIDPKENRQAIDAVEHRGDAKGKGIETIVLALDKIHEWNKDITSFALGAVCKSGFDKIPGADVRFVDVTVGEQLVGTTRFDFTGNHTSQLLGFIERTDRGWVFREEQRGGTATTIYGFAEEARTKVRR